MTFVCYIAGIQGSLKSHIVLSRFYLGTDLSYMINGLQATGTEYNLKTIDNKIEVLKRDLISASGYLASMSLGFIFKEQNESVLEKWEIVGNYMSRGSYVTEWSTVSVPSQKREMILLEIAYSPIYGKDYVPCFSNDSKNYTKYFISYDNDLYFNLSYRWERISNQKVRKNSQSKTYNLYRYFNTGIITNNDINKIGAFIKFSATTSPTVESYHFSFFWEMGFLTYIDIPKDFDHVSPFIIYCNIGVSFGSLDIF